jgi:hypothetical protein
VITSPVKIGKKKTKFKNITVINAATKACEIPEFKELSSNCFAQYTRAKITKGSKITA